MRNQRLIKANPRYVFARVSPEDILISAGPFSREYMEVTFETPQTCQFVCELLGELTHSALSREAIIQRFQKANSDLEILERLEKMNVLIPAGTEEQGKEPVFLVKNGEGLLARALHRYLEDLGFAPEILISKEDLGNRGTVIAAFDHWLPRDLRELEWYTLNQGGAFLPVVYVAEGAFIGPYVTRKTALYEDFETQFDASLFSWVGWRAFRERTSAHRMGEYPKPILPHVEFVASFAAMLFDKHRKSDDTILANKVILVDLISFYIEDVRIYRVHAGQTMPRVEI